MAGKDQTFGTGESLWFQILSYAWILVIGIAGTIAYYVLYEDYIKGYWYPMIAAFIASHGAVIGGTWHLINRIRGKG